MFGSVGRTSDELTFGVDCTKLKKEGQDIQKTHVTHSRDPLLHFDTNFVAKAISWSLVYYQEPFHIKKTHILPAIVIVSKKILLIST